MAAVALLVAPTATAKPASADPPLPVVYSLAAAAAYASRYPNTSPPGANNWSCQPSAAHPFPVVLVHGSQENMTFNWYTLSPLLKNLGYCVYALNYGQNDDHLIGAPGATPPGGTGPIEQSALQLSTFINQVLAATGASKVDIVGHSQGGMMPRWYMKFDRGVSKVDKLIGLAPTNHGTTLDSLALLPGAPELLNLGLGAAVQEQVVGSPFMQQLNAGGDTMPGVTYTVIETKYDELLTPYTSAFLIGPNVTNTVLQNQCALDFSGHLATPFDPIALSDVVNALDPAHAFAPSSGVLVTKP